MSFSVLLLIAMASDPALMIQDSELQQVKAAAKANPVVRKLADHALRAGTWSVTAHRPERMKGLDVHEYFSEGPYWWPDPRNPEGPYIRRDGERNPGRFDDNHRDLGSMASAVLALGMGAYFLDDAKCAGQAGKVLSAWFIEPQTRMNPDLEYGQAIRGISDGRGTGIIDTVALIYAVQGIVLLERSGKLDPSIAAGLRQWFADYTQWLTKSKKGRDEEKAGNNHGTWWTAQVAAFASYLNDQPLMRRMWERYSTKLVPTQIQPDGSCPREEARTRSLSYSTFNLDAFSVTARIAQARGENLWAPLRKPVDYLTPYVLKPETWKKQQITKFEPDRPVFLGLAGLGLHDGKVLETYRQLPRAESPWVVFVDLLVKGTAR